MIHDEFLDRVSGVSGVVWEYTLEELKKSLFPVDHPDIRMEDRFIYSSFNHYSIQKLKELDAKVQTAYLFSDAIITDYPDLAVQARTEALNYTE